MLRRTLTHHPKEGYQMSSRTRRKWPTSGLISSRRLSAVCPLVLLTATGSNPVGLKDMRWEIKRAEMMMTVTCDFQWNARRTPGCWRWYKPEYTAIPPDMILIKDTQLPSSFQSSFCESISPPSVWSPRASHSGHAVLWAPDTVRLFLTISGIH